MAEGSTAGGREAIEWIWLRWLGLCFLSAFAALQFQMEGLIGPRGLLPVADFLAVVRQQFTSWDRIALAPSLLWLGSGSAAIHVVCVAGLIGSLLLLANYQPAVGLIVCLVCFLSFLAVGQAFAAYQSDGMLMSAGFISLWLAPRPRFAWRWRFLPGGGERAAAGWAWFALRWLWFSIYFGSGVAKLASGDPEWRHLTAMAHYYENGPLPTWIGWYVQQRLPAGFHTATAAAVLAIELAVAWLAFGPRRARIVCFWIVTPLQIGIILTANYGFLNYIVLGLGLALLDDRHLRRLGVRIGASAAAPARGRRFSAGAVVLGAWILITGAGMAQRAASGLGAPAGALLLAPLAAVQESVQPFRIADSFGLFAVMTPARYELEFQGSNDGQTWIPYPFRYKPQDPHAAPGIYAPYQPRFDWNLWFASLDTYQNNSFVLSAELRLLENDPTVLGLFAGNPFAGHPPQQVRVVRWQYWFSTPAEKRAESVWWTRKLLGLYAPQISIGPDGPAVVQFPPRVPGAFQ